MYTTGGGRAEEKETKGEKSREGGVGRRRDGGGKERNRSRKGKDRGSASVVAEECEGDEAIRGGETRDETREREREGEWRGEGKRQIEVESGRGRGGMLLPLWSFASSGAAGETILREGNNILNRI